MLIITKLSILTAMKDSHEVRKLTQFYEKKTNKTIKIDNGTVRTQLYERFGNLLLFNDLLLKTTPRANCFLKRIL